MIRLPAHRVNDGIVVGDVRLPEVDGVDLAATVERIGDWGGDEGLYSLFLGAALVEARDAASVRSLGVIAGWRSGVIALRDDALAHAAAGNPAAVSAALGLPTDQLPAFLAAQAGDRFGWPGTPMVIAEIGGFRGFGGVWVAAPTRCYNAGDGLLAVQTDTDLWSIHADVFGHRVSRIDALPPEIPDPRFELRLDTDSYIVQVRRTVLP